MAISPMAALTPAQTISQEKSKNSQTALAPTAHIILRCVLPICPTGRMKVARFPNTLWRSWISQKNYLKGNRLNPVYAFRQRRVTNTRQQTLHNEIINKANRYRRHPLAQNAPYRQPQSSARLPQDHLASAARARTRCRYNAAL